MALSRRAPVASLVLAPLLLTGCHSGHAGRPVSAPPTGAVVVGRTTTDPVTGDALTVQDVDRDGDELLVEVSATAGTRFATDLAPAAITLVTAAGTVVTATRTPPAFTPFPGAEPGRRAGGWLAFVTPRAAGGSLQLTRTAFTVVGSQQTVPAAAYPVSLPEV